MILSYRLIVLTLDFDKKEGLYINVFVISPIVLNILIQKRLRESAEFSIAKWSDCGFRTGPQLQVLLL